MKIHRCYWCIIFLSVISVIKAFIHDDNELQHDIHLERTKRNIYVPCTDSNFVVNMTTKGTQVKIMRDSGVTLFSSNDSILSLEKLNSLLVRYMPPSADTLLDKLNRSDIVILTHKFDTEKVVILLKDGNFTIFQTGNETSAGKLHSVQTECARLIRWQMVLDPKVGVNQFDGFNHTALHWATRIGAIDVVRQLVEKGANVNAAGPFTMTPLHYAAAIGRGDILEYLVNHGANVNNKLISGATPLHIAVVNGRTDTTRRLVEHGAEINIKTDGDETTPLHLAAIKGHLEVAKTLVGKGANINEKNKYGKTPLHIASQFGHVDLIHYLLQSGADVNATDKDGCTPLVLAIKYVQPNEQQFKIVEYMITNYNADVKSKDVDGSTPLSLAILNKKDSIEKLLRQKGAVE